MKEQTIYIPTHGYVSPTPSGLSLLKSKGLEKSTTVILKKEIMTKQEAYEIATRKNLSNPNGSRMDIIYAAMDEWANQVSAAKDKEIAEIKAFSKQAIELLTDNHKLEIEKRDKEIDFLRSQIEIFAKEIRDNHPF